MSIASTVVVEPVRSRRDFEALVDLPSRVPRDRPMVPPLREFERHLFDRGHRFRGNLSPSALLDGMLMGKENPFYEHGDLELFLAKDRSGVAGRPIARIVAIHNRLHNEHNHDKVGFFGFYQCVDGGEAGRDATRALVETASAWLRERGLDAIRGPFNPTINDDCGIWVDGDTYPTFLMPSNPRYYASHLAAAGLAAVKNLRVYRMDFKELPDTRWNNYVRMTARFQRAYPTLKIRSANFKNLRSEVEAFVAIFNVAWAQNWSFAPMSYKELYAMAELFQYMVDPNLIRAAEMDVNGEPKVVGVTIALPDLNELLRYSNGRLLHPVMIWKLLRMKLGRPTRRIRIAILGVLPEYRHTAISMSLLVDSLAVAKKFGAQEVEASWILEDNRPIVQPLEAQGFHVTDTYAIYERAI